MEAIRAETKAHAPLVTTYVVGINILTVVASRYDGENGRRRIHSILLRTPPMRVQSFDKHYASLPAHEIHLANVTNEEVHVPRYLSL